jgi:Zn ribbon nucleic-acid-binding protein
MSTTHDTHRDETSRPEAPVCPKCKATDWWLRRDDEGYPDHLECQNCGEAIAIPFHEFKENRT